MKILLIAPYVNLNVDRNVNREDFYPSAALLHLAAVLRANDFEPIIVDLNNSVVHNQKGKYIDYCKKIIIDSLNKNKPDLVGINCLFSGVFPDVLHFAKVIKSESPLLKIVIGGIHPTSFYQEILANCMDVDYVAIGEGENTIVELAKAVNYRDENLLRHIKSFAYRDNDGNIKINKESNFIDDVNTLPMPAWDLININDYEMRLDNYYNPRNLPMKFKAAIFSSRACPLACNFCDMFLVMGKKHRKRHAVTIVDEIELLKNDHGVNYFSFMDDQLTMNKLHVNQLCNEIIKRDLNIQFDTPNGLWVNSLKESMIAKLAEAGLVSASLAIEHGDEYIRNEVIGKNLERKKIFEIAKLLEKYHIMSSGLFIMGFPEDTNETLKNTYDMMNELQLDRMAVNTLVPLPGTALFKQVMKDDLLIHDWNPDEFWKTPISLQQGEFIIKPYNMHIDDLYKWREIFDEVRHKYWTTNPTESSGPVQYSQHRRKKQISTVM